MVHDNLAFTKETISADHHVEYIVVSSSFYNLTAKSCHLKTTAYTVSLYIMRTLIHYNIIHSIMIHTDVLERLGQFS